MRADTSQATLFFVRILLFHDVPLYPHICMTCICVYVKAAQQRREEKQRAEKERIMNEDDTDKQRRWEV